MCVSVCFHVGAVPRKSKQSISCVSFLFFVRSFVPPQTQPEKKKEHQSRAFAYLSFSLCCIFVSLHLLLFPRYSPVVGLRSSFSLCFMSVCVRVPLFGCLFSCHRNQVLVFCVAVFCALIGPAEDPGDVILVGAGNRIASAKFAAA